MILRNIKIDDINLSDYTFSFRYPIEQNSVFYFDDVILSFPVILRKVVDCPFQIISGFDRVDQIKQREKDEITALIYSKEELSDVNAFILNFYLEKNRKPLNSVEKGIIIKKLLHYGVSEKKMIDEYLPLLSLPSFKGCLDEHLIILEMPEDIKIAVAGEFPLKIAVKLNDFKNGDALCLFHLLYDLKPGINKMNEIITLTHEISQREKIEIKNLINERLFYNIINDENLSNPQKVEKIRGELQKRRYPVLTKTKNEFHETLELLHLPPSLKITHSPYFEDNTVKLNAQFSSPYELKKLGNLILKLSEEDLIKKLLETI
ncbi:MAG: hypothetical protein SV062_08940 [Thermodesulfobacteriota bacterium]|nr:hypothetical protein [Thermodesulfobacteriota bacterium]